MNDITEMAGTRPSTQTRVSYVSTQNAPLPEISGENQAVENLSIQIQQIDRGIALMKEIRQSLESALRNLTP